MIRLTLILTLFASTIQADTIVTPDAFQTMSQGKTLYFNAAGQAFGTEQYFSDRRSLWRPASGTCDFGYWYPKDQQICFVYESWPEPICWIFLNRNGTYFARQSDDRDGLDEIELIASDHEPLNCPGPKTGS